VQLYYFKCSKCQRSSHELVTFNFFSDFSCTFLCLLTHSCPEWPLMIWRNLANTSLSVGNLSYWHIWQAVTQNHIVRPALHVCLLLLFLVSRLTLFLLVFIIISLLNCGKISPKCVKLAPVGSCNNFCACTSFFRRILHALWRSQILRYFVKYQSRSFSSPYPNFRSAIWNTE